MRILFLMFTLIFSSAVFAQQLPANNPHAIIYKEGTHYSTLDAPVPTIVDNSTSVEITEIFRFGCPACARFETSINVWKKTAPEYVSFIKNPVVWNNVTEKRAAVYYTGEVLGLSSEVSSRIFDAIHKTAKSASQAKSVFTKDDEIITMLESLGADKAKAEKTLNSFAVQSLVKRADSRTRSFAVKGTPELVIDGRYRVTSSHAKSYAEMLAIATFLSKKVAKERGIVK